MFVDPHTRLFPSTFRRGTDPQPQAPVPRTTVDQPVDPALYDRVIEWFPETLIEDPGLNDETRPLFEGHEARVTWDYPTRGVGTVNYLRWEPEWLNIKPSRFGSV